MPLESTVVPPASVILVVWPRKTSNYASAKFKKQL
jgi:hypothetical protein